MVSHYFKFLYLGLFLVAGCMGSSVVVHAAEHNASNGLEMSHCVEIKRNLMKGSEGSEVTLLQRFLQTEGDYTHDRITGMYGPLTEAAVRSYQLRSGIVQEGDADTTGFGIVGPITREHIRANSCQEKVEQKIGMQTNGLLLEPAQSVLVNGTASSVPQHTLSAEYQSYRASSSNQLYIYQGDLRKFGSTVEEVARVLKPFDQIVLTNAFSKPVTFVNGDCVIGLYEDQNGKKVEDLIVLLRKQNPRVQIYGYVSMTADNPVSCWGLNVTNQESIELQNYLCPFNASRVRECADIKAWVNEWHRIGSVYNSTSSKSYLDGIFFDLFNEYYAHKNTLRFASNYARSLRNTVSRPYKVMGNLTATAGTYFYSKPGNVMVLGANPIEVASSTLRRGDSVLVEGLSLKAGSIPSTTAPGNSFETYEKLKKTYQEKGITWMVVDSEMAYVPPSSGQTCASIYGTQPGITAQQAGCADTEAYSWLQAPYVCAMPNGKWVYAAYKNYAPYGGISYAYTEAALGSWSGKVPFCPNDKF